MYINIEGEIKKTHLQHTNTAPTVQHAYYRFIFSSVSVLYFSGCWAGSGDVFSWRGPIF